MKFDVLIKQYKLIILRLPIIHAKFFIDSNEIECAVGASEIFCD